MSGRARSIQSLEGILRTYSWNDINRLSGVSRVKIRIRRFEMVFVHRTEPIQFISSSIKIYNLVWKLLQNKLIAQTQLISRRPSSICPSSVIRLPANLVCFYICLSISCGEPISRPHFFLFCTWIGHVRNSLLRCLDSTRLNFNSLCTCRICADCMETQRRQENAQRLGCVTILLITRLSASFKMDQNEVVSN